MSPLFFSTFSSFYLVGLSFGLETSRGALGEVGGLAGFNFHISGWTVILSYGKSKVILLLIIWIIRYVCTYGLVPIWWYHSLGIYLLSQLCF